MNQKQVETDLKLRALTYRLHTGNSFFVEEFIEQNNFIWKYKTFIFDYTPIKDNETNEEYLFRCVWPGLEDNKCQ